MMGRELLPSVIAHFKRGHAGGQSREQEAPNVTADPAGDLSFSIPRADLEAAWLEAAKPVADALGLV